MKQLTISKDELKRHQQYFRDHVVPALEDLKADTERKLAAQPTSFHIWRQLKFLRLCLYYRRQLAVGKPEQLRKIQDVIWQQNYADIIEKDTEFHSRLEKAFGYEAFCDTLVGEAMIEQAKCKASANNATTYTHYDHEEIFDELNKELECLNPELKKNFQDKLSRINGKRTKKKLVNMLGEILITGIEEGRVSACGLPDWNPYLLQYNRKIRTCPYCNRQYITPLYKEGGKVRADMDHFYPKSRYPYFSLSIYNLIPCCKVCNSSLKGVKEFNIRDDKSPYELSIDDMAEFRYEPLHSPKVIFYAKDSAIDSYAKIFQMEEVYRCHENVAEEILEQSRRYSPLWIQDMIDSGLIRSKKELYQMLLGKVSDSKGILDEPLNKLKRDLVKGIWGEDVLEIMTQ